MQVQHVAPTEGNQFGFYLLKADNSVDAKLLGIMSRLVACGETPRIGVQELLNCVFDLSRNQTSEKER